MALDATAILEQLVAFDTISTKSNLALIEWVADYLHGHGVESALTRSSDGAKANLFATIGNAERGGVILSGHTDVVPVAGQAWTSDPFRLDRRDGRFYGRGTADMKGFIALALALVPQALERQLQVPLHLALSFDEEIGCLGVPALIGALPQGAARPRLAIIGEPSEMRVANAHKGIQFLRTRVKGHEAHSSAPDDGVNAITAAAEIIAEIGRTAVDFRTAAGDTRFDPPYTTFNLGRIEGGTAVNIIARDCVFDWEFRAIPGEDDALPWRRIQTFIESDLLPRMRARHADADVTTEIAAMVPPLVPDPGSPAEALARELTGSNEETTTIAFATEAGLFQSAGIPAVICGPGSIEVAHKPDEYITAAQLAEGGKFLGRLLDWARQGER